MLDAIQLRTTADNNIRITNCLYLDGRTFQEKSNVLQFILPRKTDDLPRLEETNEYDVRIEFL